MTPKEKAKKIFDKVEGYIYTSQACLADDDAIKNCAMLVVQEMIDFVVKSLEWSEEHNGNIHYWQEVLKEIEKL